MEGFNARRVSPADRELDPAAADLLQAAAAMDHPEALRLVAHIYLSGSYGPRFPRSPSRGLYCLARAVRFGSPVAALDLAALRGAVPAGSKAFSGSFALLRDLAIDEDLGLAAALARIACEREPCRDTMEPVLARLHEEEGIETPSLGDAWRTVQEAFEPAVVARALARARATLDALEEQADSERLGRLSDDEGDLVKAGRRAREEGDLPGAVFLFRRAIRERASFNARRELAKLLILEEAQGIAADPDHSLAGFWTLWELCQQLDHRAMLDMAAIYCHSQERFETLVKLDLPVAGAYCLLARENGGERYPERRGYYENIRGEKLPDPASEREAWRRVREALPWKQERER
jgi:hypothetical protein